MSDECCYYLSVVIPYQAEIVYKVTSEENESLSQIHSLPEDWSKLTSFQVAVQSLFLNVAV